ncbi:hypothetical protein CORC01_08037 [Colletotrichum orchidophilum]|uniref:Uncharacterized protein n=1 Tax=Colletotrichum orchidophilum TaxID=1209926 RepID=A0A1G4B5K1_9PEZI|nr:uncharacterized protein CORC01_08037 [Colletotrichum orchidophilum]OHE96720.1 hypothetical protein CORC01_08037 [Colletotrichum orchidophilum]
MACLRHGPFGQHGMASDVVSSTPHHMAQIDGQVATTSLFLAARLEERISKWTDGKVTGDATAAADWLNLILEHGRQARFGRAHAAGRLTVVREMADQVRWAARQDAVAGIW